MPFRLRDFLPFAVFGPMVQVSGSGPVGMTTELVTPSDLLGGCGAGIVPASDVAPEGHRHWPTHRAGNFWISSWRAPTADRQANSGSGVLPAYHFWMRLRDNSELPMAGGIGLRIGNTYEAVMYSGHVGYHVYPPMPRGTLCREGVPAAVASGAISMGSTRSGSRAIRTISHRGELANVWGRMWKLFPFRWNIPLYQRGETEKCRYRIDLT